jgi:hypothetical protein
MPVVASASSFGKKQSSLRKFVPVHVGSRVLKAGQTHTDPHMAAEPGAQAQKVVETV